MFPCSEANDSITGYGERVPRIPKQSRKIKSAQRITRYIRRGFGGPGRPSLTGVIVRREARKVTDHRIHSRGFAVLPHPCHYQGYDRSMLHKGASAILILGAPGGKSTRDPLQHLTKCGLGKGSEGNSWSVRSRVFRVWSSKDPLLRTEGRDVRLCEEKSKPDGTKGFGV